MSMSPIAWWRGWRMVLPCLLVRSWWWSPILPLSVGKLSVWRLLVLLLLLLLLWGWWGAILLIEVLLLVLKIYCLMVRSRFLVQQPTSKTASHTQQATWSTTGMAT